MSAVCYKLMLSTPLREHVDNDPEPHLTLWTIVKDALKTLPSRDSSPSHPIPVPVPVTVSQLAGGNPRHTVTLNKCAILSNSGYL